MRKAHIKQLLLLFTTLCVQSLFAQHKDANSLLWQISGNGLTKPSYLYGTIHIKDKRVFEFNDSVLPDLKKVDAFAMEIALNDSNLQKISKAAMLDNGKTLKDFFNAKDYQTLTAYLKDKGYDIELFQHFKPFALISVVTMGQMKQDMPESVDEYLYKQAKKENKQLLSVESVEEQVKALEGLSSKELMEMLVDSTEGKDLEKMIKAYADADLDKLSEMTDGDGGMDKKMDKRLLTDRNYIMADRIAAMVKQQSTFAAIGAGHLPGAKGVIALLRKKGYQVTAVMAGKTLVPPLENDEDGAIETKIDGYLQDDSTFFIQFPSKPEKMEQPATSGNVTVPTHTYLVQSTDENYALSATYADYNSIGMSIDSTMANSVLEGSVQGVAAKFNTTVASEKTVSIEGFPGREITVSVMNNAGLIHMISYLVNGRMYILQAICDPAKDNNAEMKAFFASFTLKHQ